MKYLLLVLFIFISQSTFAQLDKRKLIEEVKLEGTPVFFKPTNAFSDIRILIRKISIDSVEIRIFCILFSLRSLNKEQAGFFKQNDIREIIDDLEIMLTK